MDSLNIIFWNIQRKDLSDAISYYVAAHRVDVVVLLEDSMMPASRLVLLNKRSPKFHFCSKNSRGISIFTSFSSSSFQIENSISKYLSLVEFRFLRKKILFGAIHFPSKVYSASDPAKGLIASEIVREIENTEVRLKHSNTLLVGDFNMNPFEFGMVSPQGFNAAMSRDIANDVIRKVSLRGSRTSKTFKYFYNPMWSFLGDLSKFPPGTYYFDEDSFDNHYRWHMLDQILIRPSLIPNFVTSSLTKKDEDQAGYPLLNTKSTSKIKSLFSDHLPVIFSLDLTK